MRLLIMLFILALNCHAMAFPVFHIAGQEEFNKKVIIPIMNYTNSIKKIEKKYLTIDYYNINLSSGETTKMTPEKLYVTCKWSNTSTVKEHYFLENIIVDGKILEKGVTSFCETRVQFQEIFKKEVHNIIVEKELKFDFFTSIKKGNTGLIYHGNLIRESIQSFYKNNPQVQLSFGKKIYQLTQYSHNKNKPNAITNHEKKSLLSMPQFYFFQSKYLNIITSMSGFNSDIIINNKHFLSTSSKTEAKSVIVYSYFKINNKEYAVFKLDLDYHKEFKNQYRIINITDMKLEESYNLVYGSNLIFHGI